MYNRSPSGLTSDGNFLVTEVEQWELSRQELVLISLFKKFYFKSLKVSFHSDRQAELQMILYFNPHTSHHFVNFRSYKIPICNS